MIDDDPPGIFIGRTSEGKKVAILAASLDDAMVDGSHRDIHDIKRSKHEDFYVTPGFRKQLDRGPG